MSSSITITGGSGGGGASTWSASPAWIAAEGAASAWVDHATYVCTGVPADDGDAIRALCALGPVVFTPGTYVLNQAQNAYGVSACIFVYPDKPISSLLGSDSVEIKLADGSVVNRPESPLNYLWPVLANANAGAPTGSSATQDNNIRITGITFNWNAANQGTGNFDVSSCITFRRCNRIYLKDIRCKNWRGSGTDSVTVKRNKVSANGTNVVTVTTAPSSSNALTTSADLNRCAVVSTVGASPIKVGVNSNVTITAISGSGVGQTITLSTTIPTGTNLDLWTGSDTVAAGGWHFEKWGIDSWRCQNGFYDQIECWSDFPVGTGSYGGTGMNWLYSTRGAFSNCNIHDNKYNGIGVHSSENVSYVNIRSWLNESGMLIESSRDVKIANSTFGGQTSFHNNEWDAVDTSLGNRTIGLNLGNSYAVTITNTEFGNNGTSVGNTSCNVQADACPNDEGTFYPNHYSLTNCTLYGAGKYNLSVLQQSYPTKTPQTFIAGAYPSGPALKLTNVRMYGQAGASSNYDYRNASYGSTGVATNLATPTGGPLPAGNLTPAVPASGVAVTNYHPWTVWIEVTGGNNYDVVVAGRTLVSGGNISGFFAEPGATFTITGANMPTAWVWTTVS